MPTPLMVPARSYPRAPAKRNPAEPLDDRARLRRLIRNAQRRKRPLSLEEQGALAELRAMLEGLRR